MLLLRMSFHSASNRQKKIQERSQIFWRRRRRLEKNLGAQRVQAQDEQGQLLPLEFDIAEKVTKPLASVHTIAKTGNRVVFEDDGGYVEHKATGAKTPLRLDGKLYYLDLSVQIPEQLARSSPFCVQAAPSRFRNPMIP